MTKIQNVTALGSFRVAVKPHYTTAHVAFFQDRSAIERNGQMIGVPEIRCVIVFNGERIERSAYCSPDDTFDIYRGISLAFHRAMSVLAYSNDPTKATYVICLNEKAVNRRNRLRFKYPEFARPIVKRYRQFIERKKAFVKAT